MSIRHPTPSFAAAASVAFLLLVGVGACQEPAPRATPDVTVSLTLTEGTNMAAAASPAGDRLVLALQGSLWILPVDGGEAVRITDVDAEATHPTWSPNGDRIAYQAFSDHYYHIWTIAPDGSDARVVTEGAFDHREPAWSPDGSRIAFASDRALDGTYDVWTVDVETGAMDRVTQDDVEQHSPAWTPDGELAWVEGPAVRGVDPEGESHDVASLSAGDLRAPSWDPVTGRLAYQDNARQLVVDGTRVTEGEDVFPFPVSWLPDGSMVYTADGGVRVRDADGSNPRDIPFQAALELHRLPTNPKPRRFDDPEPRPAQGIFGPVLSPDGSRVAFAALGDLWVMPLDGEPERLTDDGWVYWGPSWGPDGEHLYAPSDRAGTGQSDLYRIHVGSGDVTRVSEITGSRIVFPTLSPDGERVAFIHGGDQSLNVLELSTGEARRVAEQAYASNVGRPTWSPDGRTLALADIQRISTRYREGRNLIRTVNVETGEWEFHEPAPHPAQLSERFEAGPVWSPDGAWMAFIMNSTLHVMPVDPAGRPTGPARQVVEGAADMPSWGPDSRTILYLASGRLMAVALDGENLREIPVNLEWAPAMGEGETRILAGGLWDGRAPEIQRNVEIRIEGSRITEIVPAGEDPEADAREAGARFVDGSQLVAMPGLWDAHVHPRVQDFAGQWWSVQLAYGLTTILSNGVSTYHTLLAREAVETGRWIGPRLLTSPIFDGERPFYGHHRAVTSPEALQIELEKARELDMDYMKAYVRAPVQFMAATAEAARKMGVPSGSHFLSPGIQTGLGGTTHLSASQRMGYSWAQSPAGASYQDVIHMYTRGSFDLASHHTRTNNLLGEGPDVVGDPRFQYLMPSNYRPAVEAQASSAPSAEQRENIRRNVATPARILQEGGLVTIGSDTPLSWPALGLHAQLRAFAYGVSNHEALQAVTINAARYALADADLGTLEAGKIADLILVRGDPLDDVANAANVELILKNGRPYTVDEILAPYR
jgi:Tol biopolymer transport system component